MQQQPAPRSMAWRLAASLGVVVAIVGLGVMAMRWAARATEPSPPQARTETQIQADREISLVVAGARSLRDALKKPESFELLSATMIDGGVICYEYRARNSFNDLRTEHHVIANSVNSSQAKDWNALCAGKTGKDYTHARAVM